VSQFSWKEYIDWGTGEILYHHNDRKTETNGYVHDEGNFLMWRQYLYGFDLRHDLYAYTDFQISQKGQVDYTADPPLRSVTEEFTEGGKIERQGHASIAIFGPETSISTESRVAGPRNMGPSHCSPGYSTARYGTLAFSSYTRFGGASVAVDTNDNLVASFGYIDFDNRAHVFSHLSEGALAELIPGAPPIPEYAPIGVLH
jgi:hypothetical protein